MADAVHQIRMESIFAMMSKHYSMMSRTEPRLIDAMQATKELPENTLGHAATILGPCPHLLRERERIRGGVAAGGGRGIGARALARAQSVQLAGELKTTGSSGDDCKDDHAGVDTPRRPAVPQLFS